ncbi:MAG: hypothetical protein AUJ92_14905 [Armatimonadetes bacterium CG2_30_59_28]|nr:MAG: hypothetical protein AUJ92_14905 [Armatimonadetes bacterium CG2_30_59_28]
MLAAASLTQRRNALTVVTVFALMVLLSEARCCDLGVHAKVPAEITKDASSKEIAFVEGFASHIALDYLTYGTTLYWGGDTQNKDLLPITLAVNGATLYQVYRKYKKTKNKKYLYGALGGIAPDVIEGIYRLSSANDDDHLFPWHDRTTTLLFHDAPGEGNTARRAAKLNIALTLAVYKIDF